MFNLFRAKGGRRDKKGRTERTMRTPSGRQVICFADRTAFFIFRIDTRCAARRLWRKILLLLLLRREIFCTFARPRRRVGVSFYLCILIRVCTVYFFLKALLRATRTDHNRTYVASSSSCTERVLCNATLFDHSIFIFALLWLDFFLFCGRPGSEKKKKFDVFLSARISHCLFRVLFLGLLE